MLEKNFKIKVQKKLKEMDSIWFFKTNELSISGIPDILGVKNGTLFALELKRDIKAKRTPLQEHTIGLIQKAGGYAVFCYPENLDEVLKHLKEL